MKKMLKRCGALALVACLLMQMTVTVWGVDQPTGNIIITNAADGEEFTIYQVFKGEAFASGTSYTVTDDFYSYFASAINTANGTSWDTSTADESKAYEFGIAAQKYAEGRKGDVKDFATELADEANSSVGTLTAGSSGEATKTDVELGYYLIVSGNEDTPLMLDVVDYNTDTSSANDFEALVKTGMLEMEKHIYHDDETVWTDVGDHEIGEDVQFRISSQLPDYSVEVAGNEDYVYVLTDKMDDNVFEFGGTVEVYTALDEDGNKTGTPLLENRYYTLHDGVEGKSTFSITISAGQMEWFDALTTYPEYIYVFFSGKLLSDANLAGISNDNKATLVYSNDTSLESGSRPTVDSDGVIKDPDGDDVDPFEKTEVEGTTGLGYYEGEVSCYTFALDLNKIIQGSENEGLAGAIFALYDSDDDQISLAKQTSTDTYYIDPDGNTDDTSTYEGTITTPEGGTVRIIGLDDDEEYTIKELKAPEGYNILNDTVSFKLNPTYSGTSMTKLEVVNNEDNKGVVTIKGDSANSTIQVADLVVENSFHTLLPTTGGIGTVLFYVLGSGLVLAAGVLLVIKKKNT